MRTKLATLLLAVAMLFAGCGAADKPSEPDRNFYYKETKWGMSLDEVLKAQGTPDLRTDEEPAPEEKEGYLGYEMDISSSSEDQSGGENNEDYEPPQYIDFYYYGQKIFDKYTAEEKYLFDENQKLWGVIDMVDIGKVSKDLMNRDEVVSNARETYMDIREILTAEYGPPAAEYTAYSAEGTYKTDETLDLDKEGAVICASRWDGDDYRFIYIIYFMNDLMIDVRYIPHDKEKVDEVNSKQQ